MTMRPWGFFLLVARATGAAVDFLSSRFTFSSEGGAGLRVGFNCSSGKWCGMIVSRSRTPEIFSFGDTYILARHGLCDYDCCWSLRDNPAPDYSCPHPQCCESTGSPVGLRSFPSLMGEGWSNTTMPTTERNILFPHGLRGDATMRSALVDAPPHMRAFQPASVIDGFNYATLSLPFGDASASVVHTSGFYVLDDTLRAVVLTGAAAGAASFDGGVTTLDVGYHGPGAFTACLVSGTQLCGCGWPLVESASLAKCVPLDSDAVQDANEASLHRTRMVLTHGSLMVAAWAIVMPSAAMLPRCWRHALSEGAWFKLHRGLMLAAVVLALSGFVVIVVFKRQQHGEHFGRGHALDGLVLTVMIVIQPLNAFLRPHKPTEQPGAYSATRAHAIRTAWRVLHAALGIGLLGFGTRQLFTGVEWSGEDWLFGLIAGGWVVACVFAAVGATNSSVGASVPTTRADRTRLQRVTGTLRRLHAPARAQRANRSPSSGTADPLPTPLERNGQ